MAGDLRLFGRDQELARLDTLLARARAGEPATVLITGSAGIGKTSLLRARLAGHEVRLLAAGGDEDESDIEYGTIGQLLRGLPGEVGADLADDVRPGAAPFRVGAVLLTAIDRLQADGPVVVVVDDAHWADEQSLRALAFGARRLRADRVVVAVTCRTEHVAGLPPALLRISDATGGRVVLEGLDLAAVEAFARTAYERPLSLGAVRRLAEHTGGNPLHLRALLSELSYEALESGRRLPVPTSYAALVAARVAACSPAAERLIAALSVLGSRATIADAAAVAEVADPLPAVDELVESELILLENASTGAHLRFAHQLVQATIAGSLSGSRKARLHGIAASVVTRDAALRHRLAATVGADPDLVEEARTAADAEASPDRAAGYLLAAAPLAPTTAEAQELVLAAATLLLLSGEPVDHLVAEIETFPASAARDYVLGRVAFAGGRLAEAGQRFDAAWTQLTAAANPDGLAGPVADMLAILAEHEGRFDAVADWAGRALLAGSESMSSATMLCFGSSVIHGPAAAAEEMAAVLADAPSANVALDAQLGLGIAQVYANQLEAAEQTLAGVVASPRVRGSMLAFVNARFYLAERHYRAGRWADALDVAESVTSVAEDSGQEWLAILPHGIAAFVLAGQGADTRAREHAKIAEQLTDTLGLLPARLLVEHVWLRIAAAAGDHARVAAIGDRLAGESSTNLPEWVHHWRAAHAEALVATGRLDDAVTPVVALEAEAAASGDVSIAADAGRARGILAAAQGDGARAEAAFATALALDPEESRPFERARLELAAGAHARRRGRRRDAAALLTQAAERLGRLGAQPWLERCEREIEACGLHPAKRSQPRDEDALTAQERLVARLVSSGMTNREVAAELVLSEKTIEYHLGRVYRKLGVRSRTELAALLRTADA